MAESIEVQAARIGDVDVWPNWPWLPVKRYGANRAGFPAIGVLFADDVTHLTRPVRVLDANAYQLTAHHADQLRSGADPAKLGVELADSYPTVELMLADGWQPD